MRYVALLRGINVGGNSKVAMPKLKQLFEELGHTNVSTYINSGNVLFDSSEKSEKALVAEMEKAIHKHFKIPVRCVVRTKANILKVAKAVPANWQNNTEQKTDILFLWEKYDNKTSLGLIQVAKGIDTLKYVDGAIAWNVKREGYNKSGMRKFIGTELYKHMTARNVNTVRKLVELL